MQPWQSEPRGRREPPAHRAGPSEHREGGSVSGLEEADSKKAKVICGANIVEASMPGTAGMTRNALVFGDGDVCHCLMKCAWQCLYGVLISVSCG